MKYVLQITKDVRENDLIFNDYPLTELEAIDLVQDNKTSVDDGWRLIRLRTGVVSSSSEIPNYVLRSREVELFNDETGELTGEKETITAKAELHTITKNSSNIIQCDNINDAWNIIQSLNPSDGYILIDEFENNSLVVYEHASLWKQEDGFVKSHGRLNNHNRTDEDRI